MDKPSLPHIKKNRKRRGFALIITLSVLMVLISLTTVMISYLDKARGDASSTEAMIQANLYFNDIKEILSRFKERKTLYNTLYATPLPLSGEDERFSMLLTCRPLRNGINFNWLSFENEPLMQLQYNAAETLWEKIVQNYGILDPERLRQILLSHMETGTWKDEEGVEHLLLKSGIYAYEAFLQLLSRYQFEADDPSVGKVPWQKFFVFLPVAKDPARNKVAGGYLSEEAVALLFDLDIASVKEEWFPGEGALKRVLDKFGIRYEGKLYADTFINQSYCDVSYTYKKHQYAFSFIDQEGEVNGFEFYGER